MENPNEFDRSKSIQSFNNDQLLKRLLRAYSKELINLAYSYVFDWGKAEDIVQDVFVKCYQHLDTFRGDASYRTWLYRITINGCKDVKRSSVFRHETVEAVDSMFSLSSDDVTPEDRVIQQAQDERVAKMVLTLPEKYKEVLMLYYYSDLDIKEISESIGKNERTIRTRLSRARQLLKKKLEEGDFNGR